MEPPPKSVSSSASHSSISPQEYSRQAARRVPAHLLFFASAQLYQGTEGQKITNVFREYYPDTEERPKETGFKALIGRVFPPSEKDKMIGKIEELIAFLKDPNSERNEMGDTMITGAQNVLDYLKSNASTTSEANKIEAVRSRFNAAAEPYHINYKINKLTRELLGVHGVPENIERVDEFVSNCPVGVRTKIFQFLDRCDQLKRENLELLGRHDGNFGKMDLVEHFDEELKELRSNDCGIINGLLREIFTHIGMDHTIPEGDKEYLRSVYNTIMHGSFTRNTQVNNDYFESVIPANLRSGNFLFDRLSDRQNQILMLNPQVLSEEINTAEFSKLNPDEKLVLIQTKLDPTEKVRLINTLRNDQLYLPVYGYFLHDMQKWESPEPNIPFKTAERTLGYMSWDQKAKIERTFILDLSRANLTNDTQVSEAFHFLSILQSLGLKTNMGMAWEFLRKNPKMYENFLKVMIIHRNLLDKFNVVSLLEAEKFDKKELERFEKSTNPNKKLNPIKLPLLSTEQKVALLRAGFSENLPTDLSRFGIVNEQQKKAALEFLAQLHIVRKDPEMAEAWQNIQAKPGVFVGMLDLIASDRDVLRYFREIKSLSTEQQVGLLQGGFDYTFRVYQFLLQARLELSLKN